MPHGAHRRRFCRPRFTARRREHPGVRFGGGGGGLRVKFMQTVAPSEAGVRPSKSNGRTVLPMTAGIYIDIRRILAVNIKFVYLSKPESLLQPKQLI